MSPRSASTISTATSGRSGTAYKQLIRDWCDVLPAQSVCLTVPCRAALRVRGSPCARHRERARQLLQNEPGRQRNQQVCRGLSRASTRRRSRTGERRAGIRGGCIVIMLVDSHCHLDFPDLSGRLPDVLAAAAAAGRRPHGDDLDLVSAGSRPTARCPRRTTRSSSQSAPIPTTRRPSRTWPSSDSSHCRLIRAASRSARRASTTTTTRARATCSGQVFRTHIAAARESGLPLVIHARNADDGHERRS